MFNINENPSGIARASTIVAGLLLCLIAGSAQSVTLLLLGLAMATFGVAWGSLEYLKFLGGLLLQAKDIAVGFVKFISGRKQQ